MDSATLDAAYNNSAAVADSAEWLAKWRRRSVDLRATQGARLDVAYGSRERQRLDYLPSGATQAPLFVFIHGGYWQRNSKEDFAFVAQGPHARGIDVAIVGYTLAPTARLSDIVAEIRQALNFLKENADQFGFNPRKRFCRRLVGGRSPRCDRLPPSRGMRSIGNQRDFRFRANCAKLHQRRTAA